VKLNFKGIAGADGDDKNDEQWPYQIKLSGTSLDNSVIK